MIVTAAATTGSSLQLATAVGFAEDGRDAARRAEHAVRSYCKENGLVASVTQSEVVDHIGGTYTVKFS